MQKGRGYLKCLIRECRLIRNILWQKYFTFEWQVILFRIMLEKYFISRCIVSEGTYDKNLYKNRRNERIEKPGMWRKVRINPCYRIKIRIFFSSPRWIYNSSYIHYKFTSNLSLDRSLYISYFPIIFRSLGTAYQLGSFSYAPTIFHRAQQSRKKISR